MPAGKLTPKQQRFVEEYLVDMNGTAAYIRAGYTATGNAAAVNAARLLTNAHIASAVQAARAELSVRTQRTVAEVMEDIRRRGKLAEEAGDFGPALKAAELEGRHLGAFEDRITHSLGAIGPDWKALLRPAQIEGDG